MWIEKSHWDFLREREWRAHPKRPFLQTLHPPTPVPPVKPSALPQTCPLWSFLSESQLQFLWK